MGSCNVYKSKMLELGVCILYIGASHCYGVSVSRTGKQRSLLLWIGIGVLIMTRRSLKRTGIW